MKDLSEELLDRHFKQQLASYKDADQARAKQSDRLIMASWMKVFEKAPFSEKLARNSLLLLMHGHLKDFGVLKEPFTDMRNCSRNLNAILDEYRGQPCKKLATGRSPTHLLKKCSTQILRPRKLEPIKEVSEHSEKEPKTSSFASIVTIIRKTNTRSSDSKDSLVSAKTGFESPNSNNVKERVELLEYELSRNKQHPSSSTFNRDQPDSGRTRSSTSLSQEITDQVNRRSSAVKNLRDCFEEMTERLKNVIDPKYAVPTKYNPKIPPPKPPKKIHQDVPAQRVRQPIGQCHSAPIGCRDTTVQGLLIRREQLRVQCLAYYNSDGTMKDVMDMPDPSMDTRKDEQRVRGFIIGAYRALERLKRWRGKSKRLRFFQTCFQKFGLRNLWELQALDRRFERVALKWYRHKVMACQQNTWLIYRRSILAQKPSYDEDDLQQMRHQIELQEQLQRERIVHLAKIRELCRINCHGIITQEVLGKMLDRLDDEQAQLDEDLKSLLRQKDQLFQ